MVVKSLPSGFHRFVAVQSTSSIRRAFFQSEGFGSNRELAAKEGTGEQIAYSSLIFNHIRVESAVVD